MIIERTKVETINFIGTLKRRLWAHIDFCAYFNPYTGSYYRSVLVIVWIEGEIFAVLQQCIGLYYAGPLGILQSLANGSKLL